MGKVSQEKVIEVLTYSLSHSKEETLAHFDINWESFRRYRRMAKKIFGDQLEVLLDLGKKYSPTELQRLSQSSVVGKPDPPRQLIDFSGTEITFGIMSDTHIGSKHADPLILKSAIQEMKDQGCAFIAHAGDLVEGMMARPNHVLELRPECIGYKAMRTEAVNAFKDCSLPIYIISGNHDMSFDIKYGIGMDLVEDFCERVPMAHYCGPNDGDFFVGKCKIKLWHGGDGAATRAQTYRDQLIIESLSGGEKPNLLITGHIHKSHYFFNRNVHCICAGTLQKQTPFMRSKKLAAHVCFWVVKMCLNPETGEIKWLQARQYPIYL